MDPTDRCVAYMSFPIGFSEGRVQCFPCLPLWIRYEHALGNGIFLVEDFCTPHPPSKVCETISILLVTV